MSASSPLPQRRILGLIFLTVFMDIIGFSIVIPLFPHLLDYYIKAEGSAGTLIGALNAAAEWMGGDTDFKKTVLFGGLLSTLYSLLQFIFSPLWGALSDRIGRRRVLTLTLAGNALSYLVWIFAAQFWVVVLTRLVCGMMAGNIAVASAAAADVTDEKDRTKGMAVVGIAIGLGFVFGPVIGGLASSVTPADFLGFFGIDPKSLQLAHGTFLGSFGLNPFSVPALIAASMALLNFLLVVKFFPETLAPERRAAADAKRPSIFDLATVRSSAVRRTSFANLVYQVAFTGMENTIVFLTFALFVYSPRDNAWLFLFNGACMIFAQGLARQLVKRLGQRKVIMLGMLIAAVAFFVVAWIPATPAVAGDGAKTTFYLGLGLISFATGLILPSVSALVSLYSDASEQGRNLGILRSAGSLARVIGPVTAALLYFHFGSHFWVYIGGALLMLPAIWVVRGLPEPESERLKA
ncbi:MAG: MFS transporter [Verrucomicrobia bacterium]|nr:MFS transporter [Verrucomicrobiota bacterium]